MVFNTVHLTWFLVVLLSSKIQRTQRTFYANIAEQLCVFPNCSSLCSKYQTSLILRNILTTSTLSVSPSAVKPNIFTKHYDHCSQSLAKLPSHDVKMAASAQVNNVVVLFAERCSSKKKESENIVVTC